jgi:hypothetical protein
MGFFAEAFERIGAAIMGGNHAQAGGTAVHVVVLDVGGVESLTIPPICLWSIILCTNETFGHGRQN